ncbi:hypothetical protein CGRA01v4_07112 [Colletotrichum graminicola]|uniref:RNase MRP protein 1 RNA binding domain-containing protein n=1 Tax=Colletotrichum graminicola (strain M1.001 / M2 / FGSC 10212) TaxID=645133 RepID=E3QCR0_COLGM|nr:uncharacterized protein GLRG_03792 [Colletotrichum graminicola M1.001]EFQ28648.1 hypothetical protein GLRG_03792 [Colletotrichum graminicola M1.001]WDK15831.1 hypothetical protein CGRA01v4_07112 [Colletotrichum graminicola]
MNPAVPTDLHQPTIDVLVPVLQILDGFNHRNKNQHRVARWWSQFDLLRRSVRRLHDALETRVRHHHTQSFRAPSKRSAGKVNAGPGTGSGDRRGEALGENIANGARLLLDTTIPSSFLAFSQLAADSQHAALGLVLLGVLARINSAIAPLVPRQPKGGDAMQPMANSSPSHRDAVTAKEGQTNPESMDLGVVISRDQMELTAKPPGRRPTTKEDAKAVAAAPIASKKKRKLVGAPITEPEPSRGVKETRSEKRPSKKKSKRGDEFSDLFSSLI